jgi:hypothetical protein
MNTESERKMFQIQAMQTAEKGKRKGKWGGEEGGGVQKNIQMQARLKDGQLLRQTVKM